MFCDLSSSDFFFKVHERCQLGSTFTIGRLYSFFLKKFIKKKKRRKARELQQSESVEGKKFEAEVC